LRLKQNKELETFSLVIEFMPEGTLYSFIEKHQKKNCPWSTRHQILSDVCEGMEFLHSSGGPRQKMEVFHQDLKTQNIMLKRDEHKVLRAKITDFGLSRMFSLLLTRRN
jgi:serine/threonine protein kinase